MAKFVFTPRRAVIYILAFLSLYLAFTFLTAPPAAFKIAASDPAYIQRAKRHIFNNKISVFSKSFCPHSRAAKELLEGEGLKYAVMELDQDLEGPAIQSYLATLSGQRTVPNIYLNYGAVHIGGNSDLQEKNASGELRRVMKGWLGV